MTPPLDPQTLLSAYAQGAFPMGDHAGRIDYYSADPRGILPLDAFHVPRTLAQLCRREPPKFDIRINHDFSAVMRGCMEDRAEGSWINQELVDAYHTLHEMGFAHSVEAWRNGELAGGLYGVAIGGAFFGESMFHRQTDASKVALVKLVERLRRQRFVLLDTQATTSHLRRFGATEIPAEEYMRRLRRAIRMERSFE
ncbi:MAG TPA: leucyl/phenylalanyl-tRNA--protein transferase [Tepidisphaeraceae bacterium]|nr:leucyl/phenylalanyl-tRNA--protein transferase [Tepidisphaeraceae bacterium]